MHLPGRARVLPFAFCALGAQAAISFGPNGTGVLTFDKPPPAVNWSTRSIEGGPGTFRHPQELEAVVQTISASLVNSPLLLTHVSPPSASALARWNGSTTVADTHSRYFVQTRPTGNAATLLMAILQNDSGSELEYLYVAYQLNFFPGDPEGALPAYQVYYSLTGTEGAWLGIPGLSRPDLGSVAALIDLRATPLHPGAPFYLLWADDNSPGNSPAYTIDNVVIGRGDVAPYFAWELGDTNVVQCDSITLSPAIEGSLPMTFQWYKGAVPIDPNVNPSATTPTLTVPNVQPTDTGVYSVAITNAFGWARSSDTAVTVELDTSPPAIIKAQWDEFDPNKFFLSFSEPVGPEARDMEWLIESLGTGDPLVLLTPGEFTSVKNDQMVFVTEGRDLSKKYKIIRTAELHDECAENVLAAGALAPILCPERRLIRIARNADGSVTLIRNCGTLEEAELLSGTWTDHTEQVNPLVLPPAEAQRFYRLRE